MPWPHRTQSPRTARRKPSAPRPSPRPSPARSPSPWRSRTSSRVEIRLDPPELGRVHIHLTTTDGGVQAVVVAQRPETHEFLRRHADVLAQELSAAGYGDVSLDFATGGEAATRDDRPPPDWYAADWQASPEPSAARAPSRQGARDALDIRL